MTTLKNDIEKDRILRRQRKPLRIQEKDASGLRFKEHGTGTQIIYCSECHGPVVDSPRARQKHAQDQPRCRAAMGVE
jgi:hypothetical protein